MNHRAAGLLAIVLIAVPPCLAGSPAPAGPSLSATLIDADLKAKKKSATVFVALRGVVIVDPGAVQEKPVPGQGHLHYRLDDGPVVATTATKLSFHGLTSGSHEITVVLAGNDHAPLGPSETLRVDVP